MRFAAAVFSLIILALGASSEGARREEPRIVEKVTPLPVALDKDFEFRKTKLFLISLTPSTAGQRTRQTTSTLGAKSTSPNQKTATLQDVPITFERQYRMFGAVTGLDQRQRFGNYFDFFWGAKRPVNRKRPDRGRKPLLYVGIVQGHPCRPLSLVVVERCNGDPPLNAALGGRRFESNFGSSRSRVRFDSMPFGLVSLRSNCGFIYSSRCKRPDRMGQSGGER